MWDFLACLLKIIIAIKNLKFKFILEKIGFSQKFFEILFILKNLYENAHLEKKVWKIKLFQGNFKKIWN